MVTDSSVSAVDKIALLPMSHFFRLATVLAFVIAAPDVSAQSDQSEVLGQRLLEAVQRVNYDEVMRLLEAAADVNVSRPDGSTPLSWAVVDSEGRGRLGGGISPVRRRLRTFSSTVVWAATSSPRTDSRLSPALSERSL